MPNHAPKQTMRNHRERQPDHPQRAEILAMLADARTRIERINRATICGG
jgi:hypothetical protein